MSFIKNLLTNKSDNYDVFFSYRRDGGDTFARMIKSELEKKKYKVYLDVDSLHSSYFDEQLLNVIEKSTNFILILTPGSLERCNNPDDWVRKEIVQAIESNCNIIPIFNKGYDFPKPNTFPADLKNIPRYQSIEYSNQYHQAAIEKLISFLLKKKKPRKKVVVSVPSPDPVPEPPSVQTPPNTITATPQKTDIQEVEIGQVTQQEQDIESPKQEVSIGKVNFQSEVQSKSTVSIGTVTFKSL